MKSNISISNHAIDRYLQRVDVRASRAEARLAIARMMTLGKGRSIPRYWMRRNGVSAQPGVTFVYCAARPGVCLILREGVVVTVVTRSLCASTRPTHLQLVRTRPTAMRAEERARWRWDGNVELDDAA